MEAPGAPLEVPTPGAPKPEVTEEEAPTTAGPGALATGAGRPP